jgi:hypothetical protein
MAKWLELQRLYRKPPAKPLSAYVDSVITSPRGGTSRPQRDRDVIARLSYEQLRSVLSAAVYPDIEEDRSTRFSRSLFVRP